ncbi:MAG: hypothetical protein LC753_13040 [Acidobacteria bacterium]|nr:hypothetical protein [Acidobacteriota bacterium]MCA1651153.1 hypothetical protein [Acidobacteriota bacterium]
MPTGIADLQRRAVELAKEGNFSGEALELNLEISRANPTDEGAWTRLARCYMERRSFAEAAGALATALELNPSNGIARSLQTEVTRRRALAPSRSEAASGFTAQDFDALAHLAPVDAARALGPKLEALLLALNDQRTAARIVEVRNKSGMAGAKLFHKNSYHAGTNGHLYAYHHGGRWEPQFNVGLFSATPWGANALRAGLGFNLSKDGSDRDRESGQEQVVSYFEALQRSIASTWRGHLVDWMEKTGGFIQFGDRPPSTDLLPDQAVEWLINAHNPVQTGWLFVGRWLFLERPDDARTLEDVRKLVTVVEDSFAALFPLWAAVYTGAR